MDQAAPFPFPLLILSAGPRNKMKLGITNSQSNLSLKTHLISSVPRFRTRQQIYPCLFLTPSHARHCSRTPLAQKPRREVRFLQLYLTLASFVLATHLSQRCCASSRHKQVDIFIAMATMCSQASLLSARRWGLAMEVFAH